MGLFLNMTKALGLSLEELVIMDYGQIADMLIEKGNDQATYKQWATQEDMDRF